MINIYSLEVPELKHLLEFSLNPKTLNKTLFGIVLDWEQPWRFSQDLEMWIEIWHEILGKIVSSLPLEEQDGLVKSVTDYVKSYRDPDFVSENTSAEDIPLAEGILQVNLGVPIIVICCKSDLVWSVDKNREQNDKILDSCLRTLREFCLTYGASLFYTSSKSNISISLLYDYIMHRIYGYPLLHKANIVAKDQIFIPSGWDSPSLIQQTDYLGGDKQFQEFLPKNKCRVYKKDEVSVTDDQEFILQIKEKLKGSARDRPDRIIDIINPKNQNSIKENPVQVAKMQPEPAGKGSQVKLQEFYQMLLDKGNKEQKDN
jgi:dynein light intermediate chain 1